MIFDKLVFGNADFMLCCFNSRSELFINANNSLYIIDLTVFENILSKSMSYICLKPLATYIAFFIYYSITVSFSFINLFFVDNMCIRRWFY